MIKYLLSIAILFLCGLVSAQVPDAELLEYNVVSKVEGGTIRKSVSYKIQINKRVGDRFAQIVIPFSKLNKVSNIHGQIENVLGGKIRKLKKSDIKERSSIASFSLYEDDFEYYFSLKHNHYPYIVSYSYDEVKKEYLHISHWYPILGNDIPTRKAVYQLTVDANCPIKFRANLMDNSKIDSTESSINYLWECSYDGKLEKEVYPYPLSKLYPNLKIVPSNFIFETQGSWNSWTSFGDWQVALLKDLGRLPELEKRKIDKLISGVNSDYEKTRILYHYLQDNTRYINVRFNTGGYIPYNAEYVVNNRYGDCKALANYFKAILKYAGIEANYCLIYAGRQINPLELDFPSSQFNHAIVYLPGQKMFIDCTSSMPYDYVSSFNQNRNALVIKEGETKFIKTPQIQIEENEAVRNFSFSHKGKSSDVEFNGRYKGVGFEWLFSLKENYSESERKKQLYKYNLPDGFELDTYEIVHPQRDSVSIDFTYSATATGVYQFLGNDVLVQHINAGIPYLEKPKDRKLPVQINDPENRRDQISYSIPVGYVANELPDSISIESEFGSLKIEFVVNDKLVEMKRQWVLKAGNIKLEEYPHFYDFVQKARNADNKTYITFSKL